MTYVKIMIRVLFLLLVLYPVTLYAAAPDRAAVVARALSAAQALGKTYGVTISTTGAPVAAADGVRVPGLSITGMDGSTYNCGRAVVRLTPSGGDRYRLDLILPPTLSGTTAAGKMLTAGFAHENISAIWDDHTAQLSDLAAQFTGLTVTAEKSRMSVQSSSSIYRPDGTFAVTLHGVATHDKNGDSRLAALTLTSRIDGGAPGSLSLDAHASGMSQLPSTPALPEHVDLNIAVTPMPWAKIADLSRLLFAAGIPQSAAMMRVELMLGLPRVLGEAHSIVSLHSLSFGNALYHGDASGQLAMDAKAPDGATGHIHARVVGLNQTISALNSQPPAPFLAVVNLAGKQGSGPDERLYDLLMSRNGPATLNGADLSALFFASPDKKSPPVTSP